jgi:NAD(P)-dependent dehydrogenase (short-subunit alcohol dehydrogenase family)
LRPESLKFLVFFSSVAARFGNAQQADYCAANEYLNKLAQQLDARWPARVVSINWGLWDRDGMVSPYVRQRMAELDIAFMPPTAGVRAFLDELEAGRRHAAEVLLGCSLTRMHALTGQGAL